MLSVVVASNVAVVESYSQVSTKSGITVNGVVYDQDGEVLTGVTIQLKGNTSIGTSTDIDGRFTITIPQEKRTPILVVSYVGMKRKKFQ